MALCITTRHSIGKSGFADGADVVPASGLVHLWTSLSINIENKTTKASETAKFSYSDIRWQIETSKMARSTTNLLVRGSR